MLYLIASGSPGFGAQLPAIAGEAIERPIEKEGSVAIEPEQPAVVQPAPVHGA